MGKLPYDWGRAYSKSDLKLLQMASPSAMGELVAPMALRYEGKCDL